MHEVEEVLGQAGNGSSAVVSGLIAACTRWGEMQPAQWDTAAWQLFSHATATGCDLNKSAQAALWKLQSGLCVAAGTSDIQRTDTLGYECTPMPLAKLLVNNNLSSLIYCFNLLCRSCCGMLTCARLAHQGRLFIVLLQEQTCCSCTATHVPAVSPCCARQMQQLH